MMPLYDESVDYARVAKMRDLEDALAAETRRAEEAEELAERYGNALERVMMTANGALETGETVAAQLPQEGSEKP